MSISLTAGQVITGLAQTGFTSPTYTIQLDQPPTSKPAKQFAVVNLGGTQVSVRAHSGSDPFTFTIERQAVIKQQPVVSANGIIVGSVPVNVYTLRGRKGMLVAGSNVRTGYIECKIGIPAGADVLDAPNVRAMVSFFGGILSNQGAGVGDTCIQAFL